MRKPYLVFAACLPLLFSLPSAASDVVDQRQQAFDTIEKTIEQTEPLISASDIDWTKLEENSAVLASKSASLQDLFPEGSTANSKARAAIWESPEKFNTLLVQLNSGFETMNKGAAGQDLAMVESGLKEAQTTCRNCHRSYRSR